MLLGRMIRPQEQVGTWWLWNEPSGIHFGKLLLQNHPQNKVNRSLRKWFINEWSRILSAWSVLRPGTQIVANFWAARACILTHKSEQLTSELKNSPGDLGNGAKKKSAILVSVPQPNIQAFPSWIWSCEFVVMCFDIVCHTNCLPLLRISVSPA